MAEIKIEKKKPTWPWVLLAVIIIAVVAFFVFQDDVEDFADDVQDELNEREADDVDDVSTFYLEDNLDLLELEPRRISELKETV